MRAAFSFCDVSHALCLERFRFDFEAAYPIPEIELFSMVGTSAIYDRCCDLVYFCFVSYSKFGGRSEHFEFVWDSTLEG